MKEQWHPGFTCRPGRHCWRLAALAMEPLWENGRKAGVARWFEAIKARPAFEPAFIKWLPKELQEEMYANGRKSWPEIEKLIA